MLALCCKFCLYYKELSKFKRIYKLVTYVTIVSVVIKLSDVIILYRNINN